jgi:hypothetical protein
MGPNDRHQPDPVTSPTLNSEEAKKRNAGATNEVRERQSIDTAGCTQPISAQEAIFTAHMEIAAAQAFYADVNTPPPERRWLQITA